MPDEFIAHHDDGVCRPMDLSDNSDNGRGSIAISASVGIKGKNLPADVLTIQQALNDVPEDQGRPVPLLKVDGICGDKTKKGIQTFQLKHFGWKLADGRVDPDKQTIAKLNELAGGPTPFLGGLGAFQLAASNPGRVARITGFLSHAFRCIRAAQTNCLMAKQVVDLAETPLTFGVSRAERMKLLNRHFDVDTYPKPSRMGILRQILNTFDMMMSVFTRPGGLWGVAIFEVDRLAKPHVAYTYSEGGYHRPGSKKTEDGKEIRLDSIYLCDKIDMKTDEVCACVIVHELSHFVGFPQRIGDHAYGWFDEPKMKKLVPSQKLHNAMNHNNFAFDALHGRKPVGL